MAEERQAKFSPVTLETVDQALYDFFDRYVDAHVKWPDGGSKKVQVRLSSGERHATSRREGFRDKNGRLILPIISLRRSAIEPRPDMAAPAVETGNITVARAVDPKTQIIQNDSKTRAPAARLPRDRAVYDIYTIPFPDFSILTYDLTVQAQYTEHMNSILEKFFDQLDIQKSFVAPVGEGRDRPRAEGDLFEQRTPIKIPYFVGFLESISDRGNLEEFTDQERILMYTAQLRVPTYLLLDPEGKKPSPRVERTAFQLDFGGECVRFVEDQEELDDIFGKLR